MSTRTLHLNAFLMEAAGHHEASWRLPESDPRSALDVGHYVRLARRPANQFDPVGAGLV